jgi:uncharacterized protein YgbK (DUF1537 family)
LGRWLILADDLTGAADAGIAFARRGWAAFVAWGDSPSGADVLALDADSRHRRRRRRGLSTRELLRTHQIPGARLFKKMDSTLRGQPAAEIAALLAALRQAGHRAMAVVAPPFLQPAAPRWVDACASRERRSRLPALGARPFLSRRRPGAVLASAGVSRAPS